MLEGNDTNVNVPPSDVQNGSQDTPQSDVNTDLLSGSADDFDTTMDTGDTQISEADTQQNVQNQTDEPVSGDSQSDQNLINAEVLLDVALQDPEVAKRLLSNPSFVAFAQSNPKLAEKLQSVQIQNTQPEPQPQQPNDPLYDIARQAAMQASQMYKQMTGDDFDPVLASPEERAYYDLLQKQAMDKLYSDYQQQIQMQQQQQAAEQTLNMVNNLAVQRFGPSFLNGIREIINSLPVAEYQKLDQEFTEAVYSGDINKALSIYESLRARKLNTAQKPQNPVNNVEPASASNIAPQSTNPSDVLNEELLKLAEEEF